MWGDKILLQSVSEISTVDDNISGWVCEPDSIEPAIRQGSEWHQGRIAEYKRPDR